MKKTTLTILAGIFILLLMLKTSITVMAGVHKGHLGHGSSSDTNIHKSDSLSVGFDAHTGVITISTCSESKKLDVMICKDGAVIYTDRDKTGKDAGLNYVLDADETGEYELHVTTEDGESVDETIVKE